MILIGGAYWVYGWFYVSTDDAYINANVIQIAPRISDQVISVNVENNQFVKKGQLLLQLDPKPFEVMIKRQSAQLIIDKANYANMKTIADRAVTLSKTNALSMQDKDNAMANLEKAQGQLSVDEANLALSKLDLEYTTIRAPADGLISNLTVRPNNIVIANQSLFALIVHNEYWVDANFKEGDLEKIKVGSPAKIVVDMYPKHPFYSTVESLSGGSGNAFSLLPPQNATGNWVKITQRVPIKILIKNPEPQFPLRIGTSATVTIKV